MLPGTTVCPTILRTAKESHFIIINENKTLSTLKLPAPIAFERASSGKYRRNISAKPKTLRNRSAKYASTVCVLACQLILK
jgi:hypothetical protein